MHRLPVTCARQFGNGVELLWQNDSSVKNGRELTGPLAAEILRSLFAGDLRYEQLVANFSSLAALEDDVTFLSNLKAEADQKLAQE